MKKILAMFSLALAAISSPAATEQLTLINLATNVSFSLSVYEYAGNGYGRQGGVNPVSSYAIAGGVESLYQIGNGALPIYGNAPIGYEVDWSYTDILGPHPGSVVFGPDFGDSMTPGALIAYSYTFGPSGAPQIAATYTNYVLTVSNNSSAPEKATWTYNGVVVKTEVLQPGQSDTWTTPNIEVSPVPENDTATWGATTIATGITGGSDGSGNPVLNFNNTGTGGGGGTAASSQTITGGGGGGGTVTVANTPAPAPTNLVTFNAPTGGAAAAGDYAQNSTLISVGQQLHADNLNTLGGLDILNNTLNADTMALTQAFRFPSNSVQVTVSNSPSSTSSNVWVQNWPSNSFPDYSNVLSQIASNTAPTNLSAQAQSQLQSNYTAYSNQMWSAIPASATNADAAVAAATTAQGDYGVDDFLAMLNPTLPPPSSGGGNMSFSFCGFSFDLDPAVRFPTAQSVCYNGFKVVALLAFLIDLSMMFWKIVSIRASQSTGGVPDLEVIVGGELLGFGGEVGGNFIGVIVAVIIPAVFIGLFSISMAYLFSHLGINVADAMDTSGFTAGMSGIALYLLTSFFPVNLLFSLVCTRITLSFTIAKLVALASAASRFLFGK